MRAHIIIIQLRCVSATDGLPTVNSFVEHHLEACSCKPKYPVYFLLTGLIDIPLFLCVTLPIWFLATKVAECVDKRQARKKEQQNTPTEQKQ